ncbi:MAG: hypothetical protein P8J13_08665 [Gammaproteobacteria bacterium]|nr:hypothetical protein [Gammaproteobacteria bacterium]
MSKTEEVSFAVEMSEEMYNMPPTGVVLGIKESSIERFEAEH